KETIFMFYKSLWIKHRILEELNKKYPVNNDLVKIWALTETSHFEIAKQIKVSPEKIIKYHESLIDKKYIICNIDNLKKPPTHMLTLQIEGRTVALEEKYLSERRNRIFKDTSILMGWLIPLLAFGLSVFIVVRSSNDNKKIEQALKELKLIKEELLQKKQSNNTQGQNETQNPKKDTNL